MKNINNKNNLTVSSLYWDDCKSYNPDWKKFENFFFKAIGDSLPFTLGELWRELNHWHPELLKKLKVSFWTGERHLIRTLTQVVDKYPEFVETEFTIAENDGEDYWYFYLERK